MFLDPSFYDATFIYIFKALKEAISEPSWTNANSRYLIALKKLSKKCSLMALPKYGFDQKMEWSICTVEKVSVFGL